MDEEGTRFGTALFGSRAFAGEALAGTGDRRDARDTTLRDAMAAAGRAARAYLGVNALFVPRRRVVPLVEKRARLRLAEVVRPLLIPVDVYVVERRAAAGR